MEPSLQIHLACTVLLCSNLFVLSNGTVISRVRASEAVNPEDARQEGIAVVYHGGSAGTQRWMRAHRNALETIPIFVIIASIAVQTGIPGWLAGLLFGGFTLFRWLHTVCYLLALQPVRTGVFIASFLCNLGVVGWLLWALVVLR